MIFTSVSGHMLGLDFSGEHRGWRSCPPTELFDAPVISMVLDASKAIAKTIETEAKNAVYLIIWTDCDREGEAIGNEIVMTSRKVNKDIIVKRAWFSAANKPDIMHAINNLRELDINAVKAVEARSEIDLRIGAAFTRFQTINLASKFKELNGKILSFGSCQFPTLGFIVERYEEVMNFKPEPFWSISVHHKCATSSEESIIDADNNNNDHNAENLAKQKFSFSWERYRLFDYMTALILYEMCIDNPEATVVQVSRKPKSKWRPLPLSTVELQVKLSRWERMPSESIMTAAEKLYQRGLISYPRTETEVFSDTFNLESLIQVHAQSAEFGAYATSLLQPNEYGHTKFQTPRKGTKDDCAHPPIHPIQSVPLNSLVPDERKVYEFVVRHFLACCSRDATGAESTIAIEIAGEKFFTNGLVIHERNYLDIYKYEKWGEKSLPNLQEGQKFMPISISFDSGLTKAPEFLSEPELIRKMDKHGIGTDATIQDHIKTVQEREYTKKIKEKQDRFVPTVLGHSLAIAYRILGHEETMSKPATRSKMEKDLQGIAKGRLNKSQVVDDAVTRYKEIFYDTNMKKQVMVDSFAKHFETVVENTNNNNNQISL